MKNTINIIIIDDSLKPDDPLIEELENLHANYSVSLFSNPERAISHIKQHITTKMIVLLDIDLGNNLSGNDVIIQIRNISKLIPVIIWSVFKGSDKDFTDFVTNHAFGYINQSEDTDVLLEKVKQAVLFIQNDVATAAEKWLENNFDKKDIQLLQDKHGTSYTAEDLITAIRQQTLFGLEVQEKLINLATGLFLYQQAEKNRHD